MSGVSRELNLGLRRLWTDRLLPYFLAASVALILLVSAATSSTGGAGHHEFALLRSATEIAALVLAIVAVLSAYRLVGKDAELELEKLGQGAAPTSVPFVLGRTIAGIVTLVVAAVLMGASIGVADAGGRHQADAALRVIVLLVNVLPLLVLAMGFTSLIGPIAGPAVAVLLNAWGAEAAYDRGALQDGFIDPSVLLTVEQVGAWLAPWPLLDRLPGLALRDQSQALLQYPVREGRAVWGADLIAVSSPGDVVHYCIYLVAALGFLYLAWRWRVARARSRPQLAPWIGTRPGQH